MSPDEINKIIDEAFNQSFKEWERQIEDELYPSAFADPYSWLRVKNALLVNNVSKSGGKIASSCAVWFSFSIILIANFSAFL